MRIVIPGKVHRNDAADATHSPIFHQVEGLCVDTNITFSDLKGTLDHAMKAFFGSNVKTRFFPSFFPFTEPSADVQISCIFCGGRGCRKCKQSGWIELLGCGMVDPAVFAFAARVQPAYDAKKISGFAFGMGVERIAMMKYGIGEIGQLYSGDIQRTGGVMLRGVPTATSPLGPRIDMLGFSVGNACTENSPAVAQTGFADASNVRHGNVDTNVNAFDFTLVSPSFPRNSSF